MLGPIQSCGHVTALSRFHPWLLTSWGSDLLFQAERARSGSRRRKSPCRVRTPSFVTAIPSATRQNNWRIYRTRASCSFPGASGRGLFGPTGALPLDEECQREPGAHVFISTRSWEPLYGIDILLEAFRQAYRVDSSLRLLLLGSGSEAGRVQAFVEVHALGRVIRTLRPQVKEDMPKWFRTADTYVSCARSDGTSVSLLEAMATGLPVVVSDIPSNREWVVEAQNGWLAPAGSSEEFADRLLRAARLRPEQRKLFSERNQRIMGQRADWDRNFPRLLEMYERITGMSVISSPEQVPPP